MRYKSNFVSSCKCYLKNRKKEASYADTSSFEALFGCNPGDILKFVNECYTCPPDLHARLVKYCEDEERAKSWVIQKELDAWRTNKGY